ncbi:F-box/kelch-repeat protein At3g23880-like [Vicia villosa]|uniref:F-box/kelch-repeat protein At3g23880-like n=1 Tax=Vicia villosa TaxID=3911 RepID=UPI00273CB718|nr:F-box/kelch-repeat protein At3g23880-like [Vicia villosa]
MNFFKDQDSTTLKYMSSSNIGDCHIGGSPSMQARLEARKVYKLQKALYGLKQTHRAWNKKIDSYMVKLGFIKCRQVISNVEARYNATSKKVKMTPSPKFFPNDLVGEILSALPVKSILRFRCVSKYCNNLVSDSLFVKLHLKRSSTRNPQFILKADHVLRIPGESPSGSDDEWEVEEGFIPYFVSSLVENPSFAVAVDPYYVVKNHEYRLIGSCNGLICLVGESITDGEYYEYSFHLWNPATRTTSPKFGFLRLFHNRLGCTPSIDDGYFIFSFGCDDSTGTYKVVASRYNKREQKTNVRILTFGDSVWRDIGSFPVDPLNLDSNLESGVYLKSTINWFAIQNKLRYNGDDYKDINVEQCFITFLDLRTETCNKYLLPRDFDEVPPKEPIVSVLGGYFCFSYRNEEPYFVIWKMEKFGVEDSWAQFFKISYQNLQIDYDYSDAYIKYHYQLKPLFISKDGDSLALRSSLNSQEIIYSCRDNRVERIEIAASRTINDDTTMYSAWCRDEEYFESLVSVL